MNSAERLSKPGERQRIAKESLDLHFSGISFPEKTNKWPKSKDPGKYTCLPEIAVKLQAYPAEAQKDFWTDCLWRLQFPNSDQLAKIISQIGSVKWAVPQADANEKNLTYLVNEYLSRLNKPPVPVVFQSDLGIKPGKWEHMIRTVYSKVENAIDTVAKISNRVEEKRIIREIAHDSTFNSIVQNTRHISNDEIFWETGAIRTFTDGCTWTLLEDRKDLFAKKGFQSGNPFIPLMEIYKLGCIPMGIENSESEDLEYRILVPANRDVATPQS